MTTFMLCNYLHMDAKGFRSGFKRRDIPSVYLWCCWQWTKIAWLNSMRKLWLKALPEVGHECSFKYDSVIRSWRTVILSTSLKLRTYLNLRTPVLKFRYDCNPRLLSSYCKITWKLVQHKKQIPNDGVVSMNSHLVNRKRNRWHPDIIMKNKMKHSSAQKP